MCLTISCYHNPAYRAYNYGCIFFNIGNYEKAIADISKSIELDPNDAYHLFVRGELYFRMNMYNESRADFMRSCELGETLGCDGLKRVWEKMNP
jgi:tetratricopeptide (TPR) repeat protein